MDDGAVFSDRLLSAAAAVASGDFHPGDVKNLLREAAAKHVGYEAFVEAGTQHDEEGDPIWEYYDAKLWRSILFWKERCETFRLALQDVQGIALNGSLYEDEGGRLDQIDARITETLRV